MSTALAMMVDEPAPQVIDHGYVPMYRFERIEPGPWRPGRQPNSTRVYHHKRTWDGHLEVIDTEDRRNAEPVFIKPYEWTFEVLRSTPGSVNEWAADFLKRADVIKGKVRPRLLRGPWRRELGLRRFRGANRSDGREHLGAHRAAPL